MIADEARQKVYEIAEELNTTPIKLRVMALEDRFNLGCLEHQDYIFILSWIYAEEQLRVIDADIVALKDYFAERLIAKP